MPPELRLPRALACGDRVGGQASGSSSQETSFLYILDPKVLLTGSQVGGPGHTLDWGKWKVEAQRDPFLLYNFGQMH